MTILQLSSFLNPSNNHQLSSPIVVYGQIPAELTNLEDVSMLTG